MKTARYLLSDGGRQALINFVSRDTLFAFDLDGTPAPIVDDPDKTAVPEEVIAGLEELKKWAYIAIITGRSCEDAKTRMGFIPHRIVGNHGVQGLPGWEAREEEFRKTVCEWEVQLRRSGFIKRDPGIRIENKNLSIAIHYRAVNNPIRVRSMLEHVINSLVPPPRRIGGKYVENLLPEDAPDKGDAFLQLMNLAGRSKGFFVGDDETDEDVFHVAGDEVFSVRVGHSLHSRARYYLKHQGEIASMLKIINHVLSAGAESGVVLQGGEG